MRSGARANARRHGRARHFAFPFGDANDLVLDMLSRHRYQLAVTVHPGGTADIQRVSMARRIGIGRAQREAAGRVG